MTWKTRTSRPEISRDTKLTFAFAAATRPHGITPLTTYYTKTWRGVDCRMLRIKVRNKLVIYFSFFNSIYFYSSGVIRTKDKKFMYKVYTRICIYKDMCVETVTKFKKKFIRMLYQCVNFYSTLRHFLI